MKIFHLECAEKIIGVILEKKTLDFFYLMIFRFANQTIINIFF